MMRMHGWLAWRLLRAQWQSGDLRVFVLALVLAITTLTAVSFFTHRIALQLSQQGASLIGGDAVLEADHPIPSNIAQQSLSLGLRTAQTLEFTSMAMHGERSQLAEIKALDGHFPLVGDFDVQLGAPKRATTAQQPLVTRRVAIGPKPGEVWLEPRLAQALQLQVGERLDLGNSQLKVSGLIQREPSRGGSLFSLAPRVMMHAQDVPATQLVQFGSRVKYRLTVAGQAKQVQAWVTQVQAGLSRGEKIETVNQARPEIRSALDKADTFLSLSALVTVMLAVVAMLLSAQPFVARCQEAAILLRVFGASRAQVQRLLLLQALLLALMGGAIGSGLGFIMQFGLAEIAGQLFAETLPAPNAWPWVWGMLLSVGMVLCLLWPALQALQRVSPMQQLRAGVAAIAPQRWWYFLPLLAVLFLLVWLLAHSLKLAAIFLTGVLLLSVLAGGVAYVMAHGLFQVANRAQLPVPMALGMRNLNRRFWLSSIQIIGFSIGAMVLILITLIKNDLLAAWQQTLPAHAPNQFVINIQPPQLAAVTQFLAQMPIDPAPPTLYAMVRGRLLANNGQPMVASDFTEERAKRLLEREFNLSPAAQLPADNQIVQGRWWLPEEASSHLISLEEGLANALHLKRGDRLTFDVAGQALTLQVASIRQVKWDNMQPNFFALTPARTLQAYPASYLTAFHLPASQAQQGHALVQQFPNLSLIDVGSVLQQVRDILSKLSLAIRFIFSFCIVAGFVVLMAALMATRDERLREASLLRALGASYRQVLGMLLTEFILIASVSALLAVLMANAVAAYLSVAMLEVPFHFNLGVSLMVFLAALVLIPLVAWWVIRRALLVPPKQVLHSF